MHPLCWKHGALTSGPSGKSPKTVFVSPLVLPVVQSHFCGLQPGTPGGTEIFLVTHGQLGQIGQNEFNQVVIYKAKGNQQGSARHSGARSSRESQLSLKLKWRRVEWLLEHREREPSHRRGPRGAVGSHDLENPWTEEPGGLQSLGLQRVGHDLTTKQQHFCCWHLCQEPHHLPSTTASTPAPSNLFCARAQGNVQYRLRCSPTEITLGPMVRVSFLWVPL